MPRQYRSLVVPLLVVAGILTPGSGDFSTHLSAASPKPEPDHPSFVKVEDRPGLPRVLLIGDSISMQYTLVVRKLLAGKANVHRPARNCRSTLQTLAELDHYLGEGNWDVIHFNWGIHDLTHLNDKHQAVPPPDGKPQVPPEEYRQNLRTLVERLKKTDARLIWASTTPIGEQAESKGYRRDRDVVAYNATAAEIMKAERIEIDDLYALVKPQSEKLLSDGVHFTPHGAQVLAEAVAGTIRNALARDPAAGN